MEGVARSWNHISVEASPSWQTCAKARQKVGFNGLRNIASEFHSFSFLMSGDTFCQSLMAVEKCKTAKLTNEKEKKRNATECAACVGTVSEGHQEAA